MSVRWSETNARDYESQVKVWRRSPDYREDTIRGVILTVTKHWADGKLVGRIMNRRQERRTTYMVREL